MLNQLLQRKKILKESICIIRMLQSQAISKSYATTPALRRRSENFQRCDHQSVSKNLLQRRSSLSMKRLEYSTETNEAAASSSSSSSSSTKKIVSIDSVMKRIHKQYEVSGTINAEYLRRLLSLAEKDPVQGLAVLTDEDLSFLLNSCCPKYMPDQNVGQRLDFFQRIWDYLQCNGKLTVEHFSIKLRMFRDNRISLPDYKSFIDSVMGKFEEISDSDFYGELLEVACASGKISQATEIMLEMRRKNVSLTERNFNVLIVCNARNKNLEGMEKVVDNMIASGLSLSIETQAALVVGYLENGKSSKAFDIIDKFKSQFESRHILDFIRTGVTVNLEKTVIEKLVQILPKHLLDGPEIPIALKNICIEMFYNKKIDSAKAVIESLPLPKFEENQNQDSFGVFLIQEMIRCDFDSFEVEKFTDYLIESKKNTRALHIATEMAIKKSPSLGLTYLQSLSKREKLRPHYFWPMIMYNFRKHGESGILKTLKIMAQYDLASDPETFKEYVMPRLSITLEDPQKALKTFADLGIKTSSIFTPFIATLLMQQKSSEVLKLLDSSTTKLHIDELVSPLVSLAVHIRVTKRYQSYADLISEILKKADNPKMDYGGLILCQIFGNRLRVRHDFFSAQRFITEMQKAGIVISLKAKDSLETILKKSFPNNPEMPILIQVLGKMCNRNLSSLESVPSPENSSLTKHPRDMTLEELECHLIELEAKHMNLRGVLRRLLQMTVRENKLERALEVKARCEELKIQNSPGMLATIVDLYIKLKDCRKAQESLQALQQTYPAFQIDEHKEIDLCSLMVKEKQYDKAIKMLEERASRQKIVGGDYVIKNVWNFLTNVAQYSAQLDPAIPLEENLTRNTFSLLYRLKYCRSNNTVLGPIIREYLLRGELNAAVEELASLAKQYRHTPLQYELMTLLVSISNAKDDRGNFYSVSKSEAQRLLKQVTSIVSSIHGSVNMNSSLLLAFAESGTEGQLRRLFMDPEFRINEDILIKNCEHIGQEGSIGTLVRLARASRGLQRIINEQRIYQMLLDNFIKDNNYTAALSLYERLEADDDLKISQEFLKNLVNLLKVNKIEVPSNVALRAQVL